MGRHAHVAAGDHQGGRHAPLAVSRHRGAEHFQCAGHGHLDDVARGARAADGGGAVVGEAVGLGRAVAGVVQLHGEHRGFGVDGVSRVGHGAGVACFVGVGSAQAQGVAGRFGVHRWCEGGCPDQAVGAGGEAAQCAVGGAHISVAEVFDFLAEGDGDRGAFACFEGVVAQGDGGGGGLQIDGVVAACGAGALVARHVGVAVGHAHQVAGVGRACGGCEGARPGFAAVGGGQGAERAVLHRDVGVVKAGDFL